MFGNTKFFTGRRTSLRPATKLVFSSLLCTALFSATALMQPATAQAPLRPLPGNRGFRPAQRPQPPKPVDQVLVKLKAGVVPRDFVQHFNAVLARDAVRRPAVRPGAPLAAAAVLTFHHTTMLGWNVIGVSDPAAVNNVLASLSKQPEVSLAQPNHRAKLLLAPPNDSYWGWQNWLDLASVLNQATTSDTTFMAGTTDDDSYWTYSWALETINAVAAWNYFPGTYYKASDRMNSSTYLPLVGDIDTGADMTHPDFSYTNQKNYTPSPPPLYVNYIAGAYALSNLYVYYATSLGLGLPETDPFDPDPTLVNPDPAAFAAGTHDTDVANGGQLNISLARSFIDGEFPYDAQGNPDYNSGLPIYAIDGFGHGTTTAGVIAAAANKGYGIPGLAYCAQVVPLKAVDNTGNASESWIEDAMVYAADHGCIAVNMSLDIGTTDYSQALQDAVDYCWQHGTLVVAAAGNDNSATQPILGLTKQWPAYCNRVLTVAASTYTFGGTPTNPLNTAVAEAQTLNPEIAASYSDYGPHIGVSAPGGDNTTFAVDASTPYEQLAGTFTGVEYVFPFVLAPSYLTALSDPNGANGSYALNNLYGVDWPSSSTTIDTYGPTAITHNYGIIQGTSVACPYVTALAALYAAKYNITQQTPNACQLLINAIERGAANVQGVANGGIRAGGGNTLGYGRIDALATLQNLNARNATVGGLVGQVKLGQTIQASLRVTFTPAINGNPVAGARSYTATTGVDGIYRMPNLPVRAGQTYNVSCSINYINARGRVDKITKVLTNVNVVAGCNQMGVDIIFN